MRLNQQETLVSLLLRPNPVLELVHVEGVGLVKVGPGQEGGRGHLALGDVLDARGQVVVVTGVVRALGRIGKDRRRQLEPVRRDAVHAGQTGPKIKHVF